MKIVIGIIIFMGLERSLYVRHHWMTSAPYLPNVISKVMNRNRFHAIFAFLHVVDPDQEDRQDKLSKVRIFVNKFKSICLNLYYPRRNLSIDERMVKSKHRSGIRQFMKDKPTKFGIKLWVLCDSSNGFTVDFDIYADRRERPSIHGLGYNVVMRLIQMYQHQGYFLHFDNFYVRDECNILACGTCRDNRKGFPSNFKAKLFKKSVRGDMR
ncbi:Uncharacterised protein at_DN0158 [Pycnogonum litorale]